ncbi:hypothetical protein [Burkholderia pyrrocinia]|uniref:hypothetical protein n=1 Tax=Burkholderia pyrrocinia TaxID=60550 RepID=UPI001BCA9AC0|nr:hypothetical protein [Burkholderia pyrrocinia]QVN19562.1 hypothetical protein JYG32_07560 [Burkholderia pyrrocinia]
MNQETRFAGCRSMDESSGAISGWRTDELDFPESSERISLVFRTTARDAGRVARVKRFFETNPDRLARQFRCLCPVPICDGWYVFSLKTKLSDPGFSAGSKHA